MKFGFAAIAALAAMAGVANAQPTLTHSTTISLGNTISAPQGIAEVDDALYVAGFNSREIGKITDALGTPVVADITGNDILGGSWVSGRGPQIVIPYGSNIAVLGDDQTNGRFGVFDANGNQVGATVTLAGNRTSAMAFWGSDPDLVVGRSNASTLADVELAGGTTESTSVAPATGYGSPIRDIVVIGDDVYALTAPTSAAGNYNIGRYSGGTAGDFAGYTFSPFISLSPFAVSVNHLGLSTYTDPNTSTTYLVTCDLGHANGPAIKFIDVSDASVDVTFQHEDLTTGVRGVEVITLGTTSYVALTRQSGTPANAVMLYEITPEPAPSSVSDWTMIEG